MSTTLYDILGIEKNATPSQIKTAYRKLAKVYHPDIYLNEPSNHLKFIELKNAYEILIDPFQRKNYDERQEMFTDFHPNDLYKKRYPTPPSSYYYPRRKQTPFSRKTYIYGTLFVIGLSITAVLFPTYLMIKSANIRYNRGVEYYEAGLYSQALDNFSMSINDLGTKNGLANYYTSYILFYHYHNYQITLQYIDLAMKDIEEDSIISELKWMKGRCYHLVGKEDVALNFFQQVGNYSHAYDSANFYSGIIYTVLKHNYEEGLKYFNQSISRNQNHLEAQYFKAYCLQKLEQHQNAINTYNTLLEKKYEIGAVYFHRALSQLKVNQRENACIDLDSAINRQVMDAIKLKSIYCP